MPRFNPPPGWDVPAGFMPPVGWRPDPRWPPAPAHWQLWIVDPVGPSAPSEEDPDLTRRRPMRNDGAGVTDAEPAETLAWSPAHARATRSAVDTPTAYADSPTAHVAPWSESGIAQRTHHAPAGLGVGAAVGYSAPTGHRAHSAQPSAGSALPSAHSAQPSAHSAQPPGLSSPPSAHSAQPSAHSAQPSARSAPPPSASSPVPPPDDRRAWYERPVPAAIAASSCVALVAVSIWAFVLREAPADAGDGPGKFDIAPPPEPGGGQGGNQAGGEQAPEPSALPEEDGDTDGEDVGDDPTTADPSEMPGLLMTDTFPAGQDSTGHTGPDGVPTNTAPIGTTDDLLLENTDIFGRSSVMIWTMNATGETVEAQFVGPTDWDATPEVTSYGTQNPPAPDGHVYVTQRIRVSTESSTPFHPFASVLVYWVSESGDVYGATSAVAPEDLIDVEPVADGQDVEGNLVLCLPESVAGAGHWVVAMNHSSNGYQLAS